MIRNNKNKILSVLSLFVLCLFLASLGSITSSCEDEVIDRFVEVAGDTLEVLGFNHIVSFELEEFSQDTLLSAAIANDSLIVYWPIFKDIPDTIAPEITVAEGATIAPASGESVPFQTGTRYMVTAEDQSTQEYVLKVEIYQAEPIFRQSEDRLRALSRASGQTAIYNVSGDFFIPDTNQTKLSLISWESGEETPLKMLGARTDVVNGQVPAQLANGYYRTKVVTGARTVERQDSLWLKLPNPTIIFPQDDTVSVGQGETFEAEGANLFEIERVEFPFVGSGASLEIVSFTETSIILRVPEDFPPGFYVFTEVHVYSPWAFSGSDFRFSINTFPFFEVTAPSP